MKRDPQREKETPTTATPTLGGVSHTTATPLLGGVSPTAATPLLGGLGLTLVADEAVGGQQLEGVDLKQHPVEEEIVGRGT